MSAETQGAETRIAEIRARSIPLQTEIIVSVAFRVSGDEFALPQTYIRHHALRTPDELNAAVDATRDAIWSGILRAQRDLIAAARATPAGGTTND